MILIFNEILNSHFLKSNGFKGIYFGIAFLLIASFTFGEGSGNWGTQNSRQSMLWYPGNSGAGGFGNRGYMLLPSNVSGYNGGHRLYVYAKAGETVFWGFRRFGTGNIRKQPVHQDREITTILPMEQKQ